jgi:hypothetical protein
MVVVERVGVVAGVRVGVSLAQWLFADKVA